MKKVSLLAITCTAIILLAVACTLKDENVSYETEMEEDTPGTDTGVRMGTDDARHEDSEANHDINGESDEIALRYAYTLRSPVKHITALDDESYNFKEVVKIKAIGMMTGEASPNQTRRNYQVGGTDLGIFVEHKDKMYIFFGDSFLGDKEGHPMVNDWRSNILAYTTDFDASDGIMFDGMIGNQNSLGFHAKEIIGSQKVPGTEHTVIPTGGFSDGENIYCYFMSIKEWGGPGGWVINYGGLAKSDNDGQTFKKLPEVQFDGGLFGQIAPLQVGEYLYCVGIPGGRFGSARLMRVKMEQVENPNAYEFLTGFQEEGSPIFKMGTQHQADAVVVAAGDVGEPSIMFNRYLGEYVLTYLKESEAAIVMRVSKELWGPWSEPIVLVNSNDYTALYGGFVHEKYTKDDGRIFYFTMSLWDPVYNSGLLQVEIERK